MTSNLHQSWIRSEVFLKSMYKKKKKATKPYFFETRAMKKHPLLCKGPVFSVFCVISISAFSISLKFPSGQKVVA